MAFKEFSDYDALGLAYEETLGPVALTLGPDAEVLPWNPVFQVQMVDGTRKDLVAMPWLWVGLSLGVRAHFF